MHGISPCAPGWPTWLADQAPFEVTAQPAHSTKPPGAYGQRVAALLFLWWTLAWLAPTMLLLPAEQDPADSAPAAAPARDAASGASGGASGSSRPSQRCKPGGAEGRARSKLNGLLDRACRLLEGWLHVLAGTPPPWVEPAGQAAALHAGLRAVLWMATLAITWMACCLAAPLYGEPPAAPAI